MDPEQIYQEVLQEEQQKGSAGPVAEGRAKAARSRAEHGSPHPKEPKWWPGSQPHLEGGEEPAVAAAEEPVEEEAVAEEQPAAAAPAEEPAEQAPAEEPAAQEAAAEAPAQEQPSAAPAQPAAAEQPAAAAEQQPAAAIAVAPPPTATPTVGVSSGTASGNRLRPEDAVSTEAQFDGQRAMYERRRLIDEVIQTGVPAAAAASSERSGSGALAVLYLLIPLLVIGFLVANQSDTGGGSAEPPAGRDGGAPAADTLVAEGTAFDRDSIEASAGKEVSFTLENRDSTVHNFAVYPDEEAATAQSDEIYLSPDVQGGSSDEVSFTAPDEPGDYPFICDYHPTTMTGTLAVK